MCWGVVYAEVGLFGDSGMVLLWMGLVVSWLVDGFWWWRWGVCWSVLWVGVDVTLCYVVDNGSSIAGWNTLLCVSSLVLME